MRVGDLITKIRLRAGDMQGVRYSDYEMLAALNEARAMLWIALGIYFSTIPRRTVVLELTDGLAPLPEDYYSLAGISENAAVEGGMVRGEGESAELSYNCVPAPAEGLGDDIELPRSIEIDVAEIAARAVAGDMNSAAQIAEASARRISQTREYARIPDRRPFR